jgi:hypothetical protein
MGHSVFSDDWLADDSCKNWVRRVPQDKHKAKCIACARTIALASMGKDALDRHASTTKHKQAMERLPSVRQMQEQSSLAFKRTTNNASEGSSPLQPQASTSTIQSTLPILSKVSISMIESCHAAMTSLP